MVAQQANTSTNENLDEIQQALIDFVKTHGRLPCVAPLTVAPILPCANFLNVAPLTW